LAEFSYVLGYLEPWIHDYGSAAVFLILTLESFGFPLPGESLLIATAILAGRGVISFPVLLLSAWCGAVVGDNIGYLIGRMLGHRLLWRYGAKLWLKRDRLRKVEEIFARYGPVTVGFARFFNVLRQLNGVVAGTLEMDWWRFVLFNALGGALWVTVWTLAGYYFGAHGSEIAVLLHKFWFAGAVTVLIVVIIVSIRIALLRKHRQRQSDATEKFKAR
jgi:membrane protein DedA with SNARE-associated domain